MIGKAIFYTLLLIAFVSFFLLYEKGFSLKNSLIISLFAPILGGLFIVTGVFVTTLVSVLIIFSTACYLMNRKKVKKFRTKKINFNIYRT